MTSAYEPESAADTPGYQTTYRPNGFGGWWLAFLGGVFALLGLAFLGGGLWLLWLGGSFYYAISGLGLLVSGFYIYRRSLTGFWIYLVTWLFTLAWSFWEVGFAPWPLVPRVVAPTVLMVLLVISLGAFFRSRETGSRYKAAHKPVYTALVGLAFIAPLAMHPVAVRAQEAAQGQNVTPDISAAAPNERTPEQTLQAGKDWPQYGGTFEAQRYSPLDQVTAENVGQLKQVWLAHTGDMPDAKAEGKYSPQNTPIEVGGHLYSCSAMGIVQSFDAATGKEEWRFDPKVSEDAIPYGATCRGVAYYKVPQSTDNAACATRIIYGTLDARLIAIDAKTGTPCDDFGANGQVNLNDGIGKTVPGWYAVTAPPAIVRGVVVTGAQVKDGQAEDAPSGVIRGYDAITGKLAWAWDMGAPDRTGAPTGDETYTRGTPNMWTAATADEKLGLVYIPLGNSSVDYYGGNRKDFENQFSSSLVAIDATTGKPVWHFQTVHYDLWDYDLGSQPTLVDVPTDKGTVPAIVLPSKQGEIYVLDRATGKSLFPVEEKPVPSGGVEPENLSKTQPFSGYASLAKPALTEKDMWGATPLDQLWCRIQFRQAVYSGEYTPPTADKNYIEYPGYNGGSDWGSVAIDPEAGILVANYNDIPNLNHLIPRAEADKEGIKPITEGGNAPKAEGAGDAQAGSPYAIDVNAGWRNDLTGIPCSAPPYGHIRAIDLKSGKTLWDEPFGSAVNNGPFGIHSHLPVTIGTPNNGGPLVTAGGLVFIAATTDNKFRAYDIKTGKIVWETDLPAGGQANPMTYEVDGRQYVVLAPGGHHFMETKVGDQIIAYALPDQG